jgi:hypothetical protein
MLSRPALFSLTGQNGVNPIKTIVLENEWPEATGPALVQTER